MSLTKKGLSGFSWSLFQQLGVSGINFIVFVLLAKFLSPDDFGVYGLLIIFFGISESLSDSGMGQSIIRSDKMEESDYGTIFITNLMLSLFFYIIIYAISSYVADFYDKPLISDLLKIYGISVILTAFSTIQQNKLTREFKFKKQASIQIPSLIISGIVGVALGYLGYGVWALVIMQVVQNFALSVQYWFLTGWRPKWLFSKDLFKKHFNFGYKLTLAGLLSTIASNIIRVVIGKFYTTAQLGFLTQAGKMRNLPVNNIASALNKVTFPLFAAVKHDKERLLIGYKKIQNIVLFVMAPTMLLLILIAKPLFIIILGIKWLPSVYYFYFYAVTGILYPIHTYNLNILKVAGKSDKYLLADVIKKTNLLIIIAVTASQGINYMMFGLVAHSFISLFINIHFGSKEINYSIREQLKDSFICILPAVVVFIICYFAISYDVTTDIFINIYKILIFAILYGFLYLSYHIAVKPTSYMNFIEIVLKIPFLTKFINRFKFLT